jgi:hypothetical protein
MATALKNRKTVSQGLDEITRDLMYSLRELLDGYPLIRNIPEKNLIRI